MFALWYSVLSYKEYKDVIWQKLSAKKQGTGSHKETAIVCPITPKKPDPSRIPTPTAEITKPPTPTPPRSPVAPRSHPPAPPKSPTPTPPPPPKEPPKPLNAPAKAVRSPSPHPIRSEVFENIEYEEDEDESSEAEDDDSVSAVLPQRAAGSASLINEEKRAGSNQPR